MSHETRYALALTMSHDTSDALDALALMSLDALDLAIGLDPDEIEASLVDTIAYHACDAFASLDDEIESFAR